MSESGKQVISVNEVALMKAASRMAALKKLTSAKIAAAGPTPMAADASKKPRILCVVHDAFYIAKFKMKRLVVSVLDATAEYESDTVILNKDEEKVAEVDKAAGTMKLFTVSSGDFVKDKKTADAAKRADETPKLVTRGNVDQVQVLKNGDLLTLTYDGDDFSAIKQFNEITIAVRRANYCKYEKETDSWTHGVSFRASDKVIKKRTGALQMYHLFLQNPSGFNPVPAPRDLLAQEGFSYEEKGDRQSSASIVLPLNWPSPDIPMSCEVVFRGELFYAKEGVLRRKVSGEVQVIQWPDLATMLENIENPDGHYNITRTVVEFCMFEPKLFKLRGVDLFSHFAKKFMNHVPIVFNAKIKMQKTAVHQFNAADSPNPNERYYNATNETLMYDFVSYLRSRGLPMSRASVLKLIGDNDWRLHSFSTGTAKMEIARTREQHDQKNEEDTSYYLLNEWSAESRDPLIKSPFGERLEYYAIPHTMPSSARTNKAIAALPAWRAANPNYQGPLADPIFFDIWQGEEVDEYCALIGSKEKMPADHPFMSTEHNVKEPENGAVDTRPFLLYAVDPFVYQEQMGFGAPSVSSNGNKRVASDAEAESTVKIEEPHESVVDDEEDGTASQSKSRARYDDPEISDL